MSDERDGVEIRHIITITTDEHGCRCKVDGDPSLVVNVSWASGVMAHHLYAALATLERALAEKLQVGSRTLEKVVVQ